MRRTYDPAQRVVKGRGAYLLRMPRYAVIGLGALILLLAMAMPRPGQAQGLPEFGPLNPVASSRSGLYFQPYREPESGRWGYSVALDYGSVVEYNRLDRADYVLDSEVMRLRFAASRDIGRRTFLALSLSVEGAYAGFLDGFLDWYHGKLGIRMSEREQRPQDQFMYSIVLPDGRTITRSRRDLFLGDARAALGIRVNSQLQTVLSVTLPTSTGPEGYRRGVPSVAVLNTLRAQLTPHLVYEGSLGVGLTPVHGRLADRENSVMLALSSGLRQRIWGSQALFGNLFYHSPYYHDTSLPALDRRELSLDFGWILQTRNGGEWRLGLTEDLEPGGPGVDLIFRVGRRF